MGDPADCQQSATRCDNDRSQTRAGGSGNEASRNSQKIIGAVGGARAALALCVPSGFEIHSGLEQLWGEERWPFGKTWQLWARVGITPCSIMLWRFGHW